MFVGPSSSLSRLENYKSKVRAFSGTGTGPDYTAPVVQFKLNEMYRKAMKAFGDQSAYQCAVISLLGRAGVSRITYGPYQAFSGSLYKLVRAMTGESLKIEAAVVVALWTSRGLTQSVLEAIRDQVFSIGEPVAP